MGSRWCSKSLTIPGSIRSLSGRPLAFTPSPSCTHLRAVTRSVRQSHRVYARPRSLARSLARPPARSSICACAPTAMCQQLLQPTHTSQYGATPRPTARLLRPSPLSCTLHPVPCALYPAPCILRPCQAVRTTRSAQPPNNNIQYSRTLSRRAPLLAHLLAAAVPAFVLADQKSLSGVGVYAWCV